MHGANSLRPAGRLIAGLAACLASAAAWGLAAPAAAPAISGADTAWLLVCTVLVLLMTVPGIILFYSGMLRSKNALSMWVTDLKLVTAKKQPMRRLCGTIGSRPKPLAA